MNGEHTTWWQTRFPLRRCWTCTKFQKHLGLICPQYQQNSAQFGGNIYILNHAIKDSPGETNPELEGKSLYHNFMGKWGTHTLLLMTIGSVHRRSNGCKVSARVSGSCIMRLTNWPSTRYPDQRSQAWLFFVCSNTILNVRIFLAKFFCHLEEQYRRARFSHHDRYEDAVDTSDSARKELVQVMAFSHVRT